MTLEGPGFKLVLVQNGKPGAWQLTIDNGTGSRIETWPSRAHALERASTLMARWDLVETKETT